MVEQGRAAARAPQELDVACNCCNGRVGGRLAELAEQHQALKELTNPSGVEVIRQITGAGIAVKDTANCCNGRVGRAPMEDLVTVLAGT